MTNRDDDCCGPSCIWFLVLCSAAVLIAAALALSTGDAVLSVALVAIGLAMAVGIVLVRRGDR